MLKIENLHARVEEKEILKGINLEVKPGEVHAIMGPNGSGKSTLASVIAGREDFEVTEGSISLSGEDLGDLDPEERAHAGVFLSFQYPVEIPGVTVTNFIKAAINESRKAKGLEDMPANEMLSKIREKSSLLEIDRKFLSRSLNEGFSGGEKKSVMKSFRWRCLSQNWRFLTKPIRDLISMRFELLPTVSTSCAVKTTPLW